jgi:transmembrane sensor
MAVRGGGNGAAEEVGREASNWLARMHGPDADMSRLDFERWRARDPRHRAAYVEVERLWKLSAGLADTPTGRAYLARKRRTPFFTMSGPRIAFASLALLLAVGAGLFVLLRGREEQVPVVAAAAPLVTRVGEIRHLRLADGTIVTLDTDSAVVPMFTDAARVVRLTRGRARFDVALQAGRPFMVEAGGRVIIDRGTLFDVALGREGVKVILLHGAVDIRDRGAGSDVAPVARLAPGQAFADAPASGVAQVAPAPRGGERWVEGMLSYDGGSLGGVVEDANRYSVHKIRLGDPALTTLRVTGSFQATPTGALSEILAATFNLRVEHTAQGDFILHPR